MSEMNSNQIVAKTVTLTPQTNQWLSLGEQMSWSFRVLGEAPMPTLPIRTSHWLIVPAHLDNTPIPTRAYRKIQSIYAYGLRPKGFVVVHEAPMQLPLPEPQKTTIQEPRIRTGSYLKMMGIAALGIGAIAGATIVFTSILILGSLILLPATIAAGVILIDPILIAVTEDDRWIEIDRWSIKTGES